MSNFPGPMHNWRYFARYGAVAFGFIVGYINRNAILDQFQNEVEQEKQLVREDIIHELEQSRTVAGGDDDSWDSPKLNPESESFDIEAVIAKVQKDYA